MKLVCNIVNIVALVMVLMLGAVSVHADEAVGSDHAVEATHLVVDDASQVEGHAHLPGDTAIHCGAPILGAESSGLGCFMQVASVRYFGFDVHKPHALALEDLRPPRR